MATKDTGQSFDGMTRRTFLKTAAVAGAAASCGFELAYNAEKAAAYENSALYKACEDFQSIFIKQMLDSMRKTVDKSQSLIQENQGEKVFSDMLYDEYSKKMSKSAGFDLADNLYKQMAFLQNLPKAPL